MKQVPFFSPVYDARSRCATCTQSKHKVGKAKGKAAAVYSSSSESLERTPSIAGRSNGRAHAVSATRASLAAPKVTKTHAATEYAKPNAKLQGSITKILERDRVLRRYVETRAAESIQSADSSIEVAASSLELNRASARHRIARSFLVEPEYHEHALGSADLTEDISWTFYERLARATQRFENIKMIVGAVIDSSDTEMFRMPLTRLQLRLRDAGRILVDEATSLRVARSETELWRAEADAIFQGSKRARRTITLPFTGQFERNDMPILTPEDAQVLFDLSTEWQQNIDRTLQYIHQPPKPAVARPASSSSSPPSLQAAAAPDTASAQPTLHEIDAQPTLHEQVTQARKGVLELKLRIVRRRKTLNVRPQVSGWQRRWNKFRETLGPQQS